MCANHEHRWRLEVKIGTDKSVDLVVYAKSLTEAISRADGWAHENYPQKVVNFSIFRMPYSSDAVAKEHGAILAPLENLFHKKGLPVEVSGNPCAELFVLPPEHQS